MEYFNLIAGVIVSIIVLLFIYFYGFESIVLLSTIDNTQEVREKIFKKIDKNQNMPFNDSIDE